MGDLLVQFGLAIRFAFDDTTRTGEIVWSERGDVFRSVLQTTYDEISKGKGKKDAMLQFLDLLTFILKQR